MAFSFGGGSTGFGSTPSTGFGGFGSTTGTGTGASTGTFQFGSTPATTTAPTAGFGFGSTQPATTSSFGSSLFGSTTSAPSTGLFGTAPTTDTFGGLAGFGQPATAAGFGSLTTPSQPTTSTFVTSSTPFSELPQQYKQLMLDMETMIRTTSTARDEIREHNKSIRGKRDIDTTSVMEKLTTLSLAIERDTHSLTSFREDVQKELSSAELATRQLSRLQPRTVTGTTTTPTVSLHENIYLPSPYHWAKLDEFHHRMLRMAQTIREIDEYLASQEHITWNEPQSLPSVLRSQYDVLMILTARLASLHEAVSDLRQQYRRIYGDDVANLMFRKVPMHTLEIPMNNAQQTLFGGTGSLAGIGMTAQPATALTTPGTIGTTPVTSGFTLPPATNPAAGVGATGGFNFGAPAPATSTPAATTSGFGFASTPAPAASSTTSSLFGAPTTTGFDSFSTPTTFSRTQSSTALSSRNRRVTTGTRR